MTTKTDGVKILSVREEITAWERYITIEKDGKEIDLVLHWSERDGLDYYFHNQEDENLLFPDEFEGHIAFLLDEWTAYFNKAGE